ncbi:MAG: NAD(P)/FAD-dependent oxidoreductase [Blastocatellia bacterium]|nr:NAD(P)/FAD-dependent oxidoreductase [Blastocatellia bacterium]MCX7752008.1 NAD(P)/FAD-dependent oxidoreductase [Blastocatellia bacterium]MDW8167114.1 NAD(P)/FAD-dependent oxidoreductase [Acidobacteriota bacterium]
MPDPLDVVIVGAGHNGLVAAAYLARAGLRVLVLERRPRVGGASVTEEVFPGFRISTAAYLCSLFPERLVRELDLPRYGYHVYAKDPAFFTPFPDGRFLIFWQDQKRTCEEIAKFSRRDAEAYPRFEEYLEQLARWMERILWHPPPNLVRMRARDLWEFGKLGWALLRLEETARVSLLKLLTQSAADFLEPWFESEEVKVTVATDGVIGTAGGPRTPGTAYVLLHHVMGKVNGHRGLWGFVRGGMGALSEAIATAARAAGVEIRTEAEVRRIIVRNGRALGACLADGEEIRARCILSNADPKRTFLTLVGESELDPEFVRQVRAIRMSGYAMKINLALDGLPSFKAQPGTHLMPHHKTTIHICPDMDYIERAWDEAKHGHPSSFPMLEITLPTTYDDSLAPPGKHIMGIFLQYAPYRLREGDWRALKDAYADRVMDLIEEYAPGFKDRVLDRQVLSPQDLEEEFGLTGGNIFHGDMSADQLFSFRPVPGWARYRTPIRGLYLCGAGTHPGGGVMGLPGYHAARTVLRDWRQRRV